MSRRGPAPGVFRQRRPQRERHVGRQRRLGGLFVQMGEADVEE